MKIVYDSDKRGPWSWRGWESLCSVTLLMIRMGYISTYQEWNKGQ